MTYTHAIVSAESKPFFEGLEAYDVVELRALALCVRAATSPTGRFERDADGRKADWRARFMARVKLLVQQQQGRMVKGGWDLRKNDRAMVSVFVWIT